ncbi:TIGR03571 family LLM class oxidoreductase [Gluconacetobacter azotocaptans]|uniref:TIGR03571 family LLM class oxidoreductase n=1 Tax=Gluconacetobacter azotocaptans TaxID=142834 RepID=UPI001959BFF9|nr:TIGR03571 family LLM class oxidoreductase [Gluconacetobacter azotocaptans]MBM9401124.1 TIGR03571 family LLM class oxidoreductase [Gluconacetobacter azotocaptans]
MTGSAPSALDHVHVPGRITLGIELPLDNDWSPEGEARRIVDGRPRGVPDLRRHADLVRKVDGQGFAAVWMRDVPVFDSVRMGDAGSVYDIFTHLGFLAGLTRHVALGTAAVVLPIRHPMMIAKAAATADALSGGRLILGIASGDRPIEYPLLGLDFERRGESFREAVAYLRAAWQPGGLPVGADRRDPTLDLLPRPAQRDIPLIVAGQAQQSDAWIATNMDGRFVYPGDLDRLAAQARNWRGMRDDRAPFITAFHLDLADNPDEPFQPFRFGGRAGRKGFLDHLDRLRAIGVDHVAVLLRRSVRPLDDVLDELAGDVLPRLGPRLGIDRPAHAVA